MTFDVFLCHNSKDKPAVRALGERLRDAGFRPWLDEWELEAGQRFRKELEAQLVQVPAAAVLVGRDGMGPWQDLEIDALLIEMVRRKCRVIPVLLENCPTEPELPLFLRGLVWVDLRETTPDPFLKLIRGIRAALPVGPPARAANGKMPPNNLPASLGDLFTGREDLLAELEKNLGQPGATALVQAQTVSGLGGVGKTRLAIELAHRHAGEYSGIFFVNADSPSDLRRNLAALAGRQLLNLNLAKTLAEDEVVEEVKVALRERPGWLLILDNVDSHEAQQALATVLPLQGGQVLITSRLRQWPPAYKQLKIDKLDPESARDYLLKATADRPSGEDDFTAAAKLAQKLGYLPLALELTAAYLRENASSLGELLASWSEEEQHLLGWLGAGSTEYPRSLASTWARSFEKLNAGAQALLTFLGHLAPEPIAVAMFETGSAVLNEAVGGQEVNLKEALAELQRYSLISRENTGKEKTIGLHRLVQAVARGRIPGEEKAVWVERVLQLILAFAPEDPWDVKSWPIWDPLRPHATWVLELAEEVGAPEPAAVLMSQLGALLHAKALYSTTPEPLARVHVAMGIKILATFLREHPGDAIDFNNLATLLQDPNRLAEAELLVRQKLAIVDSFGPDPDHPNDFVTSLNNATLLVQATSRLAAAEPLMRRALAINEASFGPDHPQVAICLNNLALLLQNTDRLAEAEPLMRRALAISETSHGPDHPNVARDLNNLALLLKATNRLAEAEPLYRRALAISETSLGPDHPDVAIRLNNLAGLLQVTNRLAEAEPLYRWALAIDETSFGPDHPSVAIDLNNLAGLLQATNRRAEAVPLLRRALAILESSLGPDHPWTATCRRNLERLLEKIAQQGQT